ncbi:hypothetical protein NMG60_11007349 [Bertholletia excelsa]
MEPVCPDDEFDPGFQQFLEDEFDAILLNLRQLENTNLPPQPRPVVSNNPDMATNLSKTSAHQSNEASSNPSDAVQDQFKVLLEDFDGFEYVSLPPCEMYPTTVQDTLAGEIQDWNVMIDYWITEGCQICVGSAGESTQDVNVTKYGVSGGGGGGGGGEGERMVNPVAGSGVGGRGSNVPSSFINYGFFVQSHGGGVNVWRWMGRRTMPKAPQRRKRRYRVAHETEAEAIARHERQKIKSREASAEAHRKRQVTPQLAWFQK